MKIKAFVRVAHGPRAGSRAPMTKIAMTTRPTNDALIYANGPRSRALPTVAFAVEFDIPDVMFKQAEQVIATMAIPEEQVTIAATVKLPAPEAARAAA